MRKREKMYRRFDLATLYEDFETFEDYKHEMPLSANVETFQRAKKEYEALMNECENDPAKYHALKIKYYYDR